MYDDINRDQGKDGRPVNVQFYSKSKIVYRWNEIEQKYKKIPQSDGSVEKEISLVILS